MARLSKEEQKAKHLSELNVARRKRYVELHGMKQFKVELTGERFDEIDNALKERGITKKQFLENAIEQFLKDCK